MPVETCSNVQLVSLEFTHIGKTHSLLLEQVFGALRTTMFILGMVSVFIGISLLAPDDAKGIVVDHGVLS